MKSHISCTQTWQVEESIRSFLELTSDAFDVSNVPAVLWSVIRSSLFDPINSFHKLADSLTFSHFQLLVSLDDGHDCLLFLLVQSNALVS